MRVWAETDIGKVRQENQDSVFVSAAEDAAYAVCVVCDGMGGASGGRIASSLASETFAESLGRMLPGVHELPEKLIKAAESANREVYQKSLDEPALNGMGTTLVAAVLHGDQLCVLNVGDSRAYLIRDGGIVQITHDHSVVEQLVDIGEITREEAKTHPRKNLITRAVGTDRRVKADVFEYNAVEGDFILLCTDGLTNIVDDSDIAEIVTGTETELVCGKLIAAALANGAPDNVTVALIAV